MGSCICKESREDEVVPGHDYGFTPASSRLSGIPQRSSVCAREVLAPDGFVNNSLLSETMDKLVNETLDVIGTIIDNEPEPPSSILMLHMITDKPLGWIELVRSLMRVVPVEHPMGPSVIALLLDDSPLPTRDSVLKVSEMVASSEHNPRSERNLCVILGCLAEKLAGPSSIALCSDSTLRYLITNIAEGLNDHVKLLSIIALEKFAQTSENKATIKKKLAQMDPNPLAILEKHASTQNYILRQIGFCARWCLDNYFPIEGREYSYQMIDVSNVNAMLNAKDVSEYLKISPDGLEARCDAYTFESVRCTFQVTSDCWYYEVLLITPGVMQIGWATKDSNFLSDDGYGIGDDKYSIGFDGCRRLIWHNAKSIPHSLPMWKSGSILGCLLDLDRHEVIFSLDGASTDPYRHLFNSVNTGFFAAASFMSFQQCRFNFGLHAFKYPPTRAFKCFNQYGNMTPQDRIFLPRHVFMEQLRKASVLDDPCTLCFDMKAIIRLEPCKHRGFCNVCAQQLTFCPMCRAEIGEKLEESEKSSMTNDEYSSPKLDIKENSPT